MSDIEQIIYTAVATLIGGTILYVAGEILSKRYIDPANELRICISEIRFVLSFFAQIIHTPISRTEERSTEAARALREKSARLLSFLELLPSASWPRKLSLMGFPREKDIIEAAVQLRALATHMHQSGDDAASSIDQVNSRIRNIKALLDFADAGED